MSIHRVRLRYSEAGAQSFHGWLSVWLTNMSPWAERPNEVPTLREQPSAHYGGDLTFEWSEDKSIILDQLDGYLAAYCDWYRLAYHVCNHDDSDRTPDDGCTFWHHSEGGAVPQWVQSFPDQ